VFEIGQGNCLDFPIYIINDPTKTEAEATEVAPDLSAFKVAGLPSEFDYVQSDNCLFKSFMSQDPLCAQSLSWKNHSKDLNLCNAEYRVRIVSDGPEVELPNQNSSEVLILGQDSTKVEWPDLELADDPEWYNYQLGGDA